MYWTVRTLVCGLVPCEEEQNEYHQSVCLKLEWHWGRAGSQHNKTVMNTFSEVLLSYRSWRVNTDFIKLIFLSGEVPGSLSHSLQDSCFTLVLTFKLICFNGLNSTWQATQDRNVLTLAEKKKKYSGLPIKADSNRLWANIFPKRILTFLLEYFAQTRRRGWKQ